ncbi:protein asteroid homolog 1-like [Tachysurus fulvidraco]|uniref:protein asteroid homolog 1-like n=1 Tax=Tachysurus fulvidraco TaxID=1234273 RepID=UPI001FEFAEC0|nr:protein asteroid homolog 1-like [Tachysurus fulvidraco]
MGVHGLYRYIESDGDFLKPRCFRESKLIIDGSNLYYNLYFRSHLDQVHGGDYDDFEKIVTLFFRNLRMCDIEPYVVLDGGADVSDKKFETHKSSCSDKIRRANSLSRGHSGDIIPILTKHVFKQILQKLGIPFIQCLAEADWEAAALASEWNCPVLSNDSDFYIFNIKSGVLPIAHFQWRKVGKLRNNSKNFIPTKSYRVQNLCAAFNRMNKYNLSLFAVILGNDYTKLDNSAFPNFSKFSSKPGATAQVDGVLMWLSQFPGPKEAIAALLSPMGKNKKSDSIRKEINKGMAEYRLHPSSIGQFFMSGEPQSVPPGLLQNLPGWALKPLAEGKLASTIIDVVTLQRVMLNPQVENFELSSSSDTSRLIRQVMYGILLCTRWQKVEKNSRSTGDEQQTDVEEYSRQGMTLTSSMVPAVLPRGVVTHLHLDSLWEEPEHLRLQILLDALCVSPLLNSLLIPSSLQLAVYATGFWLNHAQPEPKAEMFWALLIGLVYGYLCRKHQTTTEASTVISRLKNLQERKGQNLLDLDLAHALCQWQSCLKDSFNLNQLLNHPVPEPELASLYSGSLVHAVAQELMRGVEPETLLTGASFAVELYRNLQAMLECELDDQYIMRIRTRTGPRGQRARCDPDKELRKMFQHLMPDEEKDEEKDDGCDMFYEETCRARTRHISRAHTVDPRAKKYERVKWR